MGQIGEGLAREAEHGGTVCASERGDKSSCSFLRVSRANDCEDIVSWNRITPESKQCLRTVHVGHEAHASDGLHWLMCGAILTNTDTVVSENVDLGEHSRQKPKRRAKFEHKKRRGIVSVP